MIYEKIILHSVITCENLWNPGRVVANIWTLALLCFHLGPVEIKPYDITVAGLTANSSCTTTISREQHPLVASIFVSCVSFVTSSAVPPSSDLFPREYYQDLTIAKWCWMNFRLRPQIRCGEFSMLQSVLVLETT